jgi:uncharacterized protein (DUF302 family)
MSDPIAFEIELPDEYEQAVERVTGALKAEGFGILTRIDVHTTLKEKIGAAFRPYAILGACNPPLAHRGLQAELDVGLLLPCNVIVYEEDNTSSRVAVLDPVVQLSVTGRKDLEPLAQEARERLGRALAAI